MTEPDFAAAALCVRLSSPKGEEVIPLAAGNLQSKAASLRVENGALAFSMRAGEFGYLVQEQNRLNFPTPQPSLPIEVPAGQDIQLQVDPESRLESGCLLLFFLYHAGALAHRASIPLHEGKLSRRIPMPESGGRGCVAVRLGGSGTFSSLNITYSFVKSASSEAKSASTEPLSAFAARLRELRRQAPLFDEVGYQVAAPERPRRVCGVLKPASEEMGKLFRPVRADGGLPSRDAVDVMAFVFDATVADSMYGWEGSLTSRNHFANVALAKVLDSAKERKIPAVLIYDAASAARAFFDDFAGRFDVRIDAAKVNVESRLLDLCRK
jgi:hypothetical protein